MQREALLESSERAHVLWHDLAVAYDEIEQALTAPEAVPLAALAERIVALETELRPLVAQMGAARSAHPAADARLQKLWSETDRVVETLSRRQPTLVRAALAARDDTASRLSRVRNDRRQRALYGAETDATPRFTSQRA
jgi:hypothetical protein